MPGNQRLQEIITRLGEICLSRELAHAMLFPSHALAHQACLTTSLDFPEPHQLACHDPATVLASMLNDPVESTLTSESQATKFFTLFEDSCLPKPTVTAFRQPLHVCAWRLESPGRACLFVGQHPADASKIDPASLAPHTLSKALLDERSKRPTPSSIHLLSSDDISPCAIRKSLLHYAQTTLTPHQERIGSHPNSFALDTTLEEAIACLIHAPAKNHSQIELNQSPPWDKNHIDARCQELRGDGSFKRAKRPVYCHPWARTP
jgi:hypothetical protein